MLFLSPKIDIIIVMAYLGSCVLFLAAWLLQDFETLIIALAVAVLTIILDIFDRVWTWYKQS